MKTNYVSYVTALKSQGIEFQHSKHKCVGLHVTSKRAMISILKDGFDLDLADPGGWLGEGFYFWDDLPRVGLQAASCFALNSHKHIEEPVVLEAELSFESLLDLNEPDNGKKFWDLVNLMKQRPDLAGDIDGLVLFVGFFIGTEIAYEMKSDGIAWKFPIAEPPQKRRRNRKHSGYAAKTTKSIKNTRLKWDTLQLTIAQK